MKTVNNKQVVALLDLVLMLLRGCKDVRRVKLMYRVAGEPARTLLARDCPGQVDMTMTYNEKRNMLQTLSINNSIASGYAMCAIVILLTSDVGDPNAVYKLLKKDPMWCLYFSDDNSYDRCANGHTYSVYLDIESNNQQPTTNNQSIEN
ncbi:MAG: hypothetical protein RR382_00230 [Tannerellaceae bacterium]